MMTKEVIQFFEVLLRDSRYNEDNKDNINPLLIIDAAKIICNSLAEDANNIGKNPLHPDLYWKSSLEFINNLCKRDIEGEHTNVNNNNRGVFLDLLEKTYKKNERKIDMLEEIQDCVREIKVKKFMLDQIREKSARQQEYKKKKRELIRAFTYGAVQKLEMKTGLEFNISVFQKIGITDKADQKMQTPGTSKQSEENSVDSCQRSYNYRLNHVKFGYAVIYLGCKYEVSKHVSYLLDSLFEYKLNHDFEKRFCEYAFKFIDSCPCLIDYYCDKFFFVLEFYLIETCTILVTSTEEKFKGLLGKLHDIEDLYPIRVACKINDLIFRKVINLLYALYFHSKFNTRMFQFMKAMEDLVKATEV